MHDAPVQAVRLLTLRWTCDASMLLLLISIVLQAGAYSWLQAPPCITSFGQCVPCPPTRANLYAPRLCPAGTPCIA